MADPKQNSFDQEGFEQDKHALAKVIAMHFELFSDTATAIDNSLVAAHVILGERFIGYSNFFVAGGSKHPDDIRYPVNALLAFIDELGERERISLSTSLDMMLIHADRSMPYDGWRHIDELEKFLKLLVEGLDFRRKWKMDYRLAFGHSAVDWKRMATVQACCSQWGHFHYTLNTDKWRKYAMDAPPDPNGTQRIDPNHIMRYFLGFAPKSVNRETPGRFGRFLQGVLDFFSELEGADRFHNASDSLKALRRLQERLKSKKS